MTVLILLAYGSQRPETKSALEDVVALVCEKMLSIRLDAPSQTRFAWLDLDKPSLDTICAEFVAAGEAQAPVVPLLLTDAFHLRVDVPEQVRLCDRYGIDIIVIEGLGLGDGTERTVVKRIIKTMENASFSWPVDALVMGVGSSDEGANAAVHQSAANFDGMPPGYVSTAFVVGPEKIKGADAVAAAQERATKRGRGLVAVPLFIVPGLLWDRVTDVGTVAGVGQVTFSESLVELLVPIVCCRRDSRTAYVGVQVVA